MRCDGNCKLILFIVFFLVVGLLVGFNLDYIKLFIEEGVLVYGYVAILFFSFLADFIAQPIGPEVPGSIGLIFNLGFFNIFLSVLVGSYFGSITSYFVGRNFLEKDVKKLCKKRKKICKTFKKYGKFALLIACLTPVPYVPFCWLAGASRMNFFTFVIFGLVPRAFRIFVILSGVSLFF